MRAWLLLPVLSLTLAAQTTLRIGTVAAIPAVFEPVREAFEKSSGIKLTFTEMGAVDSFLALQAGKIDLASAAASMEGWLELMREKGHKVGHAYEYRHCQIGEDGLSVLINPEVLNDASMLVSDLDKPTIKKIFNGSYRNWKEVGGPDLAIVVVLWSKYQVTNREFRDKALDGEPFRADHLLLQKPSYKDLLETLGSTKGAVGIGPLVFTRSSRIWSPVQAPKIQRPLTLLLPDHPAPEVEKAVASLLAFLEGPGKKLIP